MTRKYLIFMAAALVLALTVRAACFSHPSADYRDFLLPWVEEFRAGGGFAALKTTTSNYNLPYLYFLALVSYLPISDLFLIKLLSVAFDVVLAFALWRAVRPYSRRAAAWGFAAALFLPTFVANSAYWGQCDSIYAAFCLLAFERAVNGQPKSSVIFAGLAFAFKLQAVFFLPFFIVLLIAKRVKLWHAVLFPVPYVICSLPALALGWPPSRILGIYTGQASIYSGYLTLNAPSFFMFFPENAPVRPLFTLGLILTTLFLTAVFAFAFIWRKSLDTAALAGLAAMITLGAPWFLPSMHDRYFYLAEVFMLLYAALRPQHAFLAAATTIGSFSGYHAYLVRYVRAYDLWPFTLLLLVTLIIACWSVYRGTKTRDGLRAP